jgi:uncharacterized protein (TIRG00374 family)
LSENGEKSPTLWGWHTFLSIAITVAVFIVLAAYVDLNRVWREVTSCNKGLILLGALAHYGTYPLRGIRWRCLLKHLPMRCGNAGFGLLVFFYNFVDNLVPAKLGDLYGAHIVRINCGIRRSTALGSIVFLRMVDAWVVLTLALLGSWSVFSERLPRSVVWVLIGGCVLAVAATVIILTFLLFKRSVPGWLPQKIQQMIRAFQTGMLPKQGEIIPIAFLTLVIWTLETLWIFFLALGFGLRIGVSEVLFLTMIPLLASAFPVTPSGAGVVELTLFSCLRVVGASSPLAVSLTLVNRFIDYWLHIALGILTWAFREKIGLRTWRDVSLEDLRSPRSLDTLAGREGLG